jgi:M3 family oligoendopeptidase
MNAYRQYIKKLTRHPNRYFGSFQERLTPEAVKKLLNECLEEVSRAQSLEDWEKSIYRWNETKSHLQTHFDLIELAFQCHTEDPGVEKEERRLKEEIDPVVDEWNAKIREKILNSPQRKALEDKLGRQYFIFLKLRQDSFDPLNIKFETKLNHVLSDYTKLSGSASFKVDGNKYPIAHYKKFSSSPDARLRRDSFISYSGWFLEHNKELEEIFDKSTALRRQMGDVLGYENFIPLGYQKMRRVDYGPEQVAKLRKEIHDVIVPIAGEIRAQQARHLGKKAVSVWDLDYFPQWQNGDLKVGIPEQTAAALKIYQKLSPRLAGHFQKMMEWDLIDVAAREGKAPGAFCTDFSDYRVPFIFLNSVNEATDVTTLLHESGHAFQGWESRSIELMEIRHPTLEACEVHSMGMEFLAYPYYGNFFTDEDAERFKKRHLADSILLLPYIAMVDEFQHQVYSGEAKTAEERAKAWERLEDKYMPGIDFSDAPEWKRRRWTRQLHIFQVPFYYIDYAIAQIGAWQLWVQSVRDKDKAMENYLNLCQIGGTRPLGEFFATGGLRLPFDAGMLKPLMDEILAVQPLV